MYYIQFLPHGDALFHNSEDQTVNNVRKQQ